MVLLLLLLFRVRDLGGARPSAVGIIANDGESLMHRSSMLRMQWFVSRFLPAEGRRLKVLDVGSYDVNGTYKMCFDERRFDYIGLDMEKGPNVDIVPESPYSWKEIEDDTYDVIISGQAFEHIEFFWITVAEMVRVLKKDGILCLIAPQGFGEHRCPVDCWRFFTDGMIALARYTNLNVLHAHTNCAPSVTDRDWYSSNCADSMLVATKPYSGGTHLVNVQAYKCTPTDHVSVRGNLVPFS
jgi:SAM-dependent methyltransferase